MDNQGPWRNGVVILGAYTSSQADIDSEVLWGVNLDRNKKFEDFTAEQIEAINLMRGKCLCQMRAVEQLILDGLKMEFSTLGTHMITG